MRSLQNWGEEEGDSERAGKGGWGEEGSWAGVGKALTKLSRGRPPRTGGEPKKGSCTGRAGVGRGGRTGAGMKILAPPSSLQPSQPVGRGLAVASPASAGKMPLETGGLSTSALAHLQSPSGQEMGGVPIEQGSWEAVGRTCLQRP